MFESLIASGPPARTRDHRYLLSVGIHCALVAGAAGLTRHRPGPMLVQPAGQLTSFVASHPVRRLPRPASVRRSRPLRPAPPDWQTRIEAPDLGPSLMPSSMPSVAELLHSADRESRADEGLPVTGSDYAGLATAEPLGAAMVDDPVEVVRQPSPRYPPALSQARLTGRVVLEYAVDTTGHAEAASLHTLSSTHPEFEAAARASVLASLYRPARLRGRVVRQLVRQTLSFRLGG